MDVGVRFVDGAADVGAVFRRGFFSGKETNPLGWNWECKTFFWN